MSIDSRSLPVFPGGSRRPFATGVSTYLDARPGIAEPEARIYVKFQPHGTELPFLALLDTGGHFCILNRDVTALIRDQLTEKLREVVLRTAHGPVAGELYLHTIRLLAEEGMNLDVPATVFVSPEWRAPSFFGYSGFLDRIRFAIDPRINRFYFGLPQ